jgi:hypothetical protein
MTTWLVEFHRHGCKLILRGDDTFDGEICREAKVPFVRCTSEGIVRRVLMDATHTHIYDSVCFDTTVRSFAADARLLESAK